MKNINNEQEYTNATGFEVTDDSPAFLCAVNDNMEAIAVESLLRSYSRFTWKLSVTTCHFPAMLRHPWGFAPEGANWLRHFRLSGEST